MSKRNEDILGSNHQSTKLQNRALVLKMICTGTNVSRIDISKQTGLSKMSITNIVGELAKDGLVTENANQAPVHGHNTKSGAGSCIGRRPVFLAPDTVNYLALGLYISRDNAVVSLSNLKCEIVDELKCTFDYEESEDTFIDKIKVLIHAALNTDYAAGKKLLGIGVACIGPLDINNGIILEPTNFHSLKGIPIRRVLEKEFKCPVFLDNDMNASALAEKLYGKGNGTGNFAYVGVTNGIGAGIISNGALFAGDMGFGGELGHTSINFEGPRCPCGNTGCLELYASIPQIVSQAKESVELGMDSALAGLKTIEWTNIVEYAGKGDKLALNLIDRLCRYVSIGLVNLINMFDPQSIFLGHDIALAGNLVTDRLMLNIADKPYNSRYKSVPVEISAFSDKAPIVGSVAVLLDKIFTGALNVPASRFT